MADHFGEKRIEVGRRCQSDIAAGIDPHTGTGRLAIRAERAGALNDDARLDRKSARLADRLLVGKTQRGQGRAVGDPELRLDEIHTQDLLGNRMLDLDTRVAFDEEVLSAVGIDQEFDRAGILVARGTGQDHCVGKNPLAYRLVEVGGGRYLDNLLVAQLYRTVTFMQVDDIALSVAQYLDLDVPRPRHDLLQEHRLVAERREGFALAARERIVHVLGPGNRAHATAAAASRGLQHDRIADGLRHRPGLGA